MWSPSLDLIFQRANVALEKDAYSKCLCHDDWLASQPLVTEHGGREKNLE